MASILSLLDTPEPPHITMKPRAGTRAIEELNAQMNVILKGPDLDRENRELSRAAVLLWHDHFDAAHEIAQEIENADGSLVHGILHRREPDFSNARYWFRRVGSSHPSFECVAGKIKALLFAEKAGLIAEQIMPGDRWHPLEFVDFVEDASERQDAAYDRIMRHIQAAEIYCFLGALPSRPPAILPKNAFGPPSV